jgi:hypothetical protein
MINELTGKEITEPCKILFVDYKNWNIGIFNKNITLEQINEICDNDSDVMPPIVLTNKPTNE